MRRRSMPGNGRRQLEVGRPLCVQHRDRCNPPCRCGRQGRKGRDASHLAAVVALAAVGGAGGRFVGRLVPVAVTLHGHGRVGLCGRHGRHRGCRMAGQHELRPQQRDDREDREMDANAAVASAHGKRSLHPGRVSSLDLNQTQLVKPGPAVAVNGNRQQALPARGRARCRCRCEARVPGPSSTVRRTWAVRLVTGECRHRPVASDQFHRVGLGRAVGHFHAR